MNDIAIGGASHPLGLAPESLEASAVVSLMLLTATLRGDHQLL